MTRPLERSRSADVSQRSLITHGTAKLHRADLVSLLDAISIRNIVIHIFRNNYRFKYPFNKERVGIPVVSILSEEKNPLFTQRKEEH